MFVSLSTIAIERNHKNFLYAEEDHWERSLATLANSDHSKAVIVVWCLNIICSNTPLSVVL